MTRGFAAFLFASLTSSLPWTLVVAAGDESRAAQDPVCSEQLLLRDDVSRLSDSRCALIDASGARTFSRFHADFTDALPLLGHEYQDVLTLAPGVTDTDLDGSPNVHGARQTGMQYRLDGQDVTDPATGATGINLSPLSIESVEILTAGAPADRGRAAGGFADVTTRSGGNDLAWKVALFWRGRLLDGDGAGNDDVVPFDEEPVDWHDTRAAGSAGGPIVRDRLWYFAALELLDATEPAGQAGTDLRITSKGTYYFGKLSWQANPAHRLDLQVAGDPRRTEGLGLSLHTSNDSGYDIEQRTVAAKLGWAATLSPDLILEAALTRLDSGLSVEPSSNRFEPIETTLVAPPPMTSGPLRAVYPCSFLNCSEALGERKIYQIGQVSGRVSGPYFFTGDDSRTRDAVSATLSYFVAGGSGEQLMRTGFEFADESSRQETFTNPVLFDFTTPFFGFPAGPNQVSGFQILTTALPGRLDRTVTNFSTGLFLIDSWKPRTNIAVTAGVRFDREDLDAGGFESFDPRAERRRSIGLWRAVCDEAIRQGVSVPPQSNCSPLRTYEGGPPRFLPPLMSYLDQDMDGSTTFPARSRRWTWATMARSTGPAPTGRRFSSTSRPTGNVRPRTSRWMTRTCRPGSGSHGTPGVTARRASMPTGAATMTGSGPRRSCPTATPATRASFSARTRIA